MVLIDSAPTVRRYGRRGSACRESWRGNDPAAGQRFEHPECERYTSEGSAHLDSLDGFARFFNHLLRDPDAHPSAPHLHFAGLDLAPERTIEARLAAAGLG